MVDFVALTLPDELEWWQAYLINLGYIILCMFVNLMGVSSMGNTSKVFFTELKQLLAYGLKALSCSDFLRNGTFALHNFRWRWICK